MTETDSKLRLLIIDDEKFLAETMAEILERAGYECVIATSGKEGSKKIENEEFDIVLTDLRMADVDGLTIVKKVKKELPDAEVMVISGMNDVSKAVETIKEGAAHYLIKSPSMHEELKAILEQLSNKIRLGQDNRRLREQLDEKFGFEGVVGKSRKMLDILTRLKAIAPTKATVLILGENGTGKELVARALHFNSPRKPKAFVAMNCAALNENLLDDEMFGHEAGAFTGADKQRKGRFEFANGGTLFLDEVGDMPLSLQAKLLRVLENGEVSRIGSNDTIKVDVRLVAATNRNLETLIKEGKFRQDLYYRLRVATIMLPPLRERPEDTLMLASHFLKDFNKRYGRTITLSEAVKKAFVSYSWPGNVRELRNQIESMVVQDVDNELNLDDIQEGDPLKQVTWSETKVSGADHLVGRPLWEVERFYKERALELTNGNREEAAKILGIGERTLYRDIQEWKLQDKIKEVWSKSSGNLSLAATELEMKPDALKKELKKWNLINGDE